MTIPNPPAAIADNGWELHDKCRCGGRLRYKYRHPDKPGYELEWIVKYFQFRILEGRKVHTPITNIKDLDTILSAL